MFLPHTHTQELTRAYTQIEIQIYVLRKKKSDVCKDFDKLKYIILIYKNSVPIVEFIFSFNIWCYKWNKHETKLSHNIIIYGAMNRLIEPLPPIILWWRWWQNVKRIEDIWLALLIVLSLRFSILLQILLPLTT